MPDILPKDDIDQILLEAYTKSITSMIRNSVEYNLGVVETIDAIIDDFKQKNTNYLNTLKNYAEFYYLMVKKYFPDIKVIQYRIGFDSTTMSPTILMIISHNDKDFLPEIQNLARITELFLWKKDRWDGNFWTQTDNNVVQNTIDNDFPYLREKID